MSYLLLAHTLQNCLKLRTKNLHQFCRLKPDAILFGNVNLCTHSKFTGDPVSSPNMTSAPYPVIEPYVAIDTLLVTVMGYVCERLCELYVLRHA